MTEDKLEKSRRGYRACLHCRSRKAKCDLGNIDAPSSPPCSRCKRESRECMFAPSRRGGNNRKRPRMSSEDGHLKLEGESTGQYEPSTAQMPTSNVRHPLQTFPYPHPPPAHPRHPPLQSFSRLSPPLLRHTPYYGHDSSSAHSSPTTDFPDQAASQGRRSALSKPQPYHPPSVEPSKSSPSPKCRRMQVIPPLRASDPSSIVVADMRNESDALQILALASGQAASREDDGIRVDEAKPHAIPQATRGTVPFEETTQSPVGRALSPRPEEKGAKGLSQFPLVKMGILTKKQMFSLVNLFFKCHHHFFPIIPSAIIPRTMEQLATFGQNEKYLLTAFVIIASRVDNDPGMRIIHDRSWAVMRKWISKVQCLGEPPTVGLVESLLLLAENLPRFPKDSLFNDPTDSGTIEEPHGAENRQAWQMIGLAVRSAYEIGLDKLGLQLIPESDRTLEVERATLAWVYCYLFDRHVSIRLGKGFWTRGGAVCFRGYSSSAQTGPAAALVNFPFLREIKDGDPGGESPQDDLGSLVQAYLELTMMMSNAHDVLYPNVARTRSLVAYGEYFKYIDEMARSLDGFKILWRHKKWRLFPLTDTVWVMFYYIQLYICAFSFQAHVERATIRGEEEYRILEQQYQAKGNTSKPARPSLSLFPRGAAQSPDARYIFQMCDAARELIHICVYNLYPGGALPYLPSRFLLWFTYGAIVLLKAIYSGAMLRADHKRTLDLIDGLCTCFAQCSDDDEFPAVRYGRQLEALRKKLAGLSNPSETQSPNGSQTFSLPKSQHQHAAKVTDSFTTDTGSPHSHTSIAPYEDNAASDSSQPMAWQTGNRNGKADTADGEPTADTTNWQLPTTHQYTQPITFPYPATPNTSMPLSSLGHAPVPHHHITVQTQPYVAPPHQQPFMEFGVAQSSNGLNMGMNDQQSNLGFVTLEDWFGFTQAGTVNGGGTQGHGHEAHGPDHIGDGDTMGLAGVGLDLQDFWMNVGPGEAQGGFPFR
ncbi:hypothetical protein L204_104386 [Cryptococcus depauperatus]